LELLTWGFGGGSELDWVIGGETELEVEKGLWDDYGTGKQAKMAQEPFGL